MIISTSCSGDKNLEILFKVCNFRFAFLHAVLRCSVKWSLLSIMTPKSFSETLVLIVIFLYLKLSKVLGVPRVIKWHLSEFSTRKLLKNHSSKIKKSFWSFWKLRQKFCQMQINCYHWHNYKRLNFQQIGKCHWQKY